MKWGERDGLALVWSLAWERAVELAPSVDEARLVVRQGEVLVVVVANVRLAKPPHTVGRTQNT